MRALSPSTPQQTQRSTNPVPVGSPITTADAASPPTSTPITVTVTDTASPSTSTPILSVLPDSQPGVTTEQRCMQCISSNNLIAENSSLKEQLAQLRREYQAVLDHSVESDQRLLQFTDTVFLPPRSLTDLNCINKSIQTVEEDVSCPTTSDCAVQCDPPTICENQLCIFNRELVNSLKTTIEVLEAQIITLSNECMTATSTTEEPAASGDWQTVQRKSKRQINRDNIDPLNSGYNSCGNARIVHNEQIVKGKYKANKVKARTNFRSLLNTRQPKTPHRTNVIRTDPTNKSILKPILFHKVLIEGDSHTRNMASILQQCVGETASVTGVCKPSAKLLDAVSETPPPTGSCCIILAGTNDVAVGEDINIYKHLEQRILSKRSSAEVIVCTIPHRHDLPRFHPLNRRIELINAYINELCERLKVKVIFFNIIPRRLFTRHGMHLRIPGKRMLARLMYDRIVEISKTAVVTTPKPDKHINSASSPMSPLPFCLLHDSFADAVKSSSLHGPTPTPPNNQLNTSSVDLCTPFLGNGRFRVSPVKTPIKTPTFQLPNQFHQH